ncbi:carboxypeptidase-like regulatory domain-containing protein [Bremerella sp. P1]|uniref:carboxypeptidase-like regulatory domain-containing protein n=1 Tax=Bremerella sp. P1 TaxID=3026424 RepID=UPI002367C273|nr:carboxypeptidase-like regulatory domain-containing protein [Bremerella sp. P1]WDI43931.1 carboxypeptidase-like regulatory domain-containing protein [Bremerella sp. P1]
MNIMRFTARQFGFCAALTIVLVAVGCSQEDYGDLGKVTGTVTLDGKPYPNAVVRFSPEKGRPSTAVTDDTGSYELTYIRTTKGAEPGEHRVAISTEPPTVDDNYKGPKFKDPIPVRYNRRSELTRTVELGPNEFDFELKSK